MLNFIHLQTVDSTNTYALNLLRGSSDVQSLNKTVVIADEQTAGRGRVNRNFFSPANTGVYFTAIYAPPAAIDAPAKLTVAAAVAVCRALQKFFSVDSKIKWVNDVYVNQKKVCGILAEGHINATTQKLDAAVVGIGINLCTQNFPAELSKKAGAVLPNNAGFDEAQFALAKQQLIEAVCADLFAFYEAAASMPCGFADVVEEYKQRSFLIGRRVKVVPAHALTAPASTSNGCTMPSGIANNSAASTSNNSSMPNGIESPAAYFAEAVDIDSDARLVVRTDGGEERRLDSGEVSLEITADE